MREYAEEFLGAEDAQGKGGTWIDYKEDFPYRDLNIARADRRLHVYILGLGFDPLVWKPELLTVCVIEAQAFDRIFSSMVSENEEGLILKGRGSLGLPFEPATIERYCSAADISPNAKACLQLAWKHRAILHL
jgi:hypothetical protein